MLFICLFSMGTGERELLASCPPVTLFTLMFTASKLSIASRAPPLPAEGELTVSTGWNLRLHSKSLPQPFSLPLPLAHCPGIHRLVAGWIFLKQMVESLLGRGPSKGGVLGCLAPLGLEKELQ